MALICLDDDLKRLKDSALEYNESPDLRVMRIPSKEILALLARLEAAERIVNNLQKTKCDTPECQCPYDLAEWCKAAGK